MVRRLLSRSFGVFLIVLGIAGLAAIPYGIIFADTDFEWGFIGVVAVSLVVIQMGRWRFTPNANPLAREHTDEPQTRRVTTKVSESADALITHVEFQSTAFPAYETEAEDINPGQFGTRLAEYLAAELRRRGEKVGDIGLEDWGVLLPIEDAGFDLWIGLGNYPEHPDGFLCFIEPHGEYVRRPWRLWEKIPTRQRIEVLRTRIDDALRAHQGIRNITWSSYEQFNRGASA